MPGANRAVKYESEQGRFEPVSECKIFVALPVNDDEEDSHFFPESVKTQPNPPGTAFPDGPVQPESSSLENRIAVVVGEGAPPMRTCFVKEHQEKVMGRTDRPAMGAPQPAVLLATSGVSHD